MPVLTKRWDEPAEPTDGLRILITRFRPRGLCKTNETWSIWMRDLAPSAELLKAFQGKGRAAIGWSTYRVGYIKEMRAQSEKIVDLARKSRSGETITLLCASSCLRENRCHRSLLKALIDAAAVQNSGK